jgi:hypothetical protein
MPNYEHKKTVEMIMYLMRLRLLGDANLCGTSYPPAGLPSFVFGQSRVSAALAQSWDEGRRTPCAATARGGGER